MFKNLTNWPFNFHLPHQASKTMYSKILQENSLQMGASFLNLSLASYHRRFSRTPLTPLAPGLDREQAEQRDLFQVSCSGAPC